MRMGGSQSVRQLFEFGVVIIAGPTSSDGFSEPTKDYDGAMAVRWDQIPKLQVSLYMSDLIDYGCG